MAFGYGDDRTNDNGTPGLGAGGAAPPVQPAGRAPVLDRINGYFKNSVGRDASDQELNQWGTNIDAGYEGKIRDAIYNTDEARAYRQRQAQPATATDKPADSTPPAKSQPTGSPVTANGQIAPQQGPQFTATPSATRDLQPLSLAGVPAYKGTQFNVPLPTAYTPGSMPNAYGGSQFDQFNAPDQAGNNAQQSSLISAILSNPDTLNANVVAQMKESQKQQALLMRDQLGQQLDQGAVARGTLGSGQQQAQFQGINQDTLGQILNANRGIDIQAAQTNRQDELNALNASEQLAQGQLGRATGAYNTRLGGQQAQASDTQAASQSALQRALAIEQQKQAAFDSQFRNADLNFGVQQGQANENYKASNDAVQRILSQFGMNATAAGQANQNYGTDVAAQSARNDAMLNFQKYLEQQREFNGTLGLSYNQLDQQGQQWLLDWLFGNKGR